MNHKQLYGQSIREGFNKFNAENPHVFKSFEEQALKAINNGRTKISSDLIINYILVVYVYYQCTIYLLRIVYALLD